MEIAVGRIDELRVGRAVTPAGHARDGALSGVGALVQRLHLAAVVPDDRVLDGEPGGCLDLDRRTRRGLKRAVVPGDSDVVEAHDGRTLPTVDIERHPGTIVGRAA